MENIRAAIEICKNTHQNPERHSTFGVIPVEIKSKIFDKLNFSQRKKLRLVCPSWRSIVDDKMQFNAMLTNSTLEWVKKCNYHLESLCIQDLTETFVGWKTDHFQVKDLIVGRGNSSQNVLKFLTHFFNGISGLTLQNLSFGQIAPITIRRALPRLQWFCLGTLSITMGTKNLILTNAPQYATHIDGIIFILKSIHLPTLKNLKISMDYADRDSATRYSTCQVEFKKPLMEIISFILKHKSSLKELNLSVLGKPAPDERILSSELFYELPKLQLESFSTKFDTINTLFVSTLILSLNKVATLKIHETYWTDGYKGSVDTRLKLTSILRKHGPVLEVLKTKTVAFPYLTLEYLQILKSLEIHTCYPNNIGSPETPPIETLTKFSTFILNEDIANLDDRSIRCVRDKFPNVQELEVILLGEIYKFSREHFETLLKMKNLSKLKIGQHFSLEFLNLCDALGMESGISYFSEEDRVLMDNMDNYHCLDLEIDAKRLPMYYRPFDTVRANIK